MLKYIRPLIIIISLATTSMTLSRAASEMDELTSVDAIRPRGEWIDATIPDTLTLADHGRLAVNCMTGNVDPDNNFLVFQAFDFWEKPPVERQPSGLHSKNSRALTMLRTMSGSEQNLDIESGMMKVLFTNSPFMVKHWYKRDPNPAWRDKIDTFIKNYNPNSSNVVHVENRAFHPPESTILPDGTWKFIGGNQVIPYNPPEEPHDDHVGTEGCVKWHQIWTIRDLVSCCQFSNDRVTREQLLKFTRFCLRPELWEQTPDWGSPGNEHGIWGGHFHGGTGFLQALLDVGTVERDSRIKQIAREGYDHARRMGNIRLGWFPCWSSPEKFKRGGNLKHLYEVCGTADTLILAVKLTDAGMGDYWDDVDSIARRLAELQWIEEDEMLRKAGGTPESNALIKRFVGGFGNGGLTSRVYQTTGCCSANGAIALYYAWEGITRFREGVASVNMFLNRASKWMEIDSYLPYEGKVVLKNKQAHTAMVRIPYYVDPAGITSSINQQAAAPVVAGRQLIFQDLKPGDTIIVEFPLEETVSKYTINGRVYQVKMRGGSVISMGPRNPHPELVAAYKDHYVIYQKNHRNITQAPLRQVKRFIPDRVIDLSDL
jgi:hypothetical protein